MDPAAIASGALVPLAWPAAVAGLAVAAWRAPWSRFASGEATHVYFGTVLFLVLLWNLRGSVGPAFEFHLLGIGGFCLAAGPALALLGGAVVVGATTGLRDVPVAAAAQVWLALVAIPVAVQWGVLRLAERLLPANLFVYIFVASFLGAGLAYAAGAIGGAALLAAAGAQAPSSDFVPFVVLLAFAEATLTGMLISLGVVYRPGWVATFDDARYLRGR